MNLFFFLFFSYLLTNLGYLLGKATEYEHKEIKSLALKFSILLVGIFYIVLFWIFFSSIYFYILFFILIFFGFSIWKRDLFRQFHDILLLTFSIIIIWNYFDEWFFMPLILIFSMVIEHSFSKFEIKSELYKLSLLIICYLVFNIL